MRPAAQVCLPVARAERRARVDADDDAQLADGRIDCTLGMTLAKRVQNVRRVDVRHLHQVRFTLIENITSLEALAAHFAAVGRGGDECAVFILSLIST